MRYDKRSGRILVDVTDLARYAYQRENPRALSERFGFTRLADPQELPDDPEERAGSPAERGTELHHVAETDASLIEGTQTKVPLSGEFTVDTAVLDPGSMSVKCVTQIPALKTGDGSGSDEPDPAAAESFYSALSAELDKYSMGIIK